MCLSNNRRLFVTAMLMAVVLCLAPGAEPLADDDYLSILEAEAADTGNAVTPAPVSDRKPVKPESHITPDLGFEEFEEELRTRYAGTHLLYMKLSRAKRRSAWKSYRDDNALSSLRENIVSLMSSS